MLEVCLLGRFEVRRDGESVPIPSRAGQSLFAYLLLHPGISHRREQLAGLIAPEIRDEAARSALRHALWRLRKSLGAEPLTGADYFLVDELSIGLNPRAAIRLDVDALTAPAATAEELAASLDAYGGDLLPGFYEDWAQGERGRLEAIYEGRMAALLDALAQARRWGEAQAWAERWIAQTAAPEAAYRALMVAHAAQGDAARAAGAYRRCEEALRNELGVEPAAATRDLYARLARGEELPGLPAVMALPWLVAGEGDAARPHAPADAPVAGEPPFMGLQTFDIADADRFFGRETLTGRLVERLGESNFLAIVGASGSGKSSVARAGLLPALMAGALPARPHPPRPGSRDWQYFVITPTGHPLRSLAVALTRRSESITAAATLARDLAADAGSLGLHAARLASAGARPSRVLLLIDQFEEVFTLCRREEERAAFIANLPAPAEDDDAPLTVVLTLRADFYAACADYPALRAALAGRQEYIGAMTRDELRRAIECPAERGGWTFEPGLVDALLHDAGAEPGALPLLSHALLETWRRRRGRSLTFAGYAEAGGVAGAVAATAERAYADFRPEQQAATQRIFLHLTEPGEGAPDTRRRAAIAELVTDPASRAVIESTLHALAAARLITLSEDHAEVAHEALIREWPRLREWLAVDRDALRVHRRLGDAAHGWAMQGRDAGECYRGARLARAVEWAEAHAGEMNGLEREFLAASRELAEREAREREEARQRELWAAQQLAEAEAGRAETQHRAARRVRRIAAGLAVALLVALAAGGAAFSFARQARQNAAAIAVERTLAESRELASAAVAGLATDPQLGLLLAMESARVAQDAGLTPPPNVEDALHRAVQAARLRATVSGEAGVAISPDGELAATKDAAGVISVWRLAAWDARGEADTTPLYTLPGTAGAALLAFDLRPTTLVESAGANVTVWDLQARQPRATLTGHAGEVTRLALAADGRRLATLDRGGIVRYWDTYKGQELFRVGDAGEPARVMDLSPGGGRLVVGRGDVVEVWQPATRRLLATLPQSALAGRAGVRFCGEETVVAQAMAALTVWDATTGQKRYDLPGYGGTAPAAFNCRADAAQLAVAGRAAPVRVWELASGRELGPLTEARGAADVAFAAEGALLVTRRKLPLPGRGEQAQVWEAAADAEITVYPLTGPARAATISPDGRLAAASVFMDGSQRVWLLPDEADAFRLTSRRARYVTNGEYGADRLPFAFSPDSRALAAGGQLGRVTLLGMADVAGETAAPAVDKTYLPLPEGAAGAFLYEVAFSPDGTRLAAAADRLPSLEIWDLAARDERGRPTAAPLPGLDLPAPARSLAWSPGGRIVALGLESGDVALVEPQRGATLALIDAHSGTIPGVAFSPDGARLATAGGDGIARVWTLVWEGMERVTGATPAAETGRVRGGVHDVAFTPDGARLATAGDDGTVRLWDAATGRELVRVADGRAPVAGLGLSADGSRLVAGSDALRVYALTIEQLLALAQSRATRELTAEERAKYLRETVAVAATPAPAYDLTPVEVVEAFVAAWATGDPDAVAALLQPNVEYALDTSAFPQYPLRSLSEVRMFVTSESQAEGGEFEIVRCAENADEAGRVDCDLTYRDGCSDALLGAPLHLAATFWISGGKIGKVESAMPPKEYAQRHAGLYALTVWGSTRMPADFTLWGNTAMTTEGAALESGQAMMRMCAGYAASLPKRE